MPRIRTIKPEFWTDKRVAKWDVFTRLFFIGLWSAADDHGRGSSEPARLAAELFPYDMANDSRECLANVSRALLMLSEDSRITLYEVGGEGYFQIENWAKHQKVDKPSKSRIPLKEEGIHIDSRESRESVASDSRLEQGTGNREQGTGKEKPDAGKPARFDPLDLELPESIPAKAWQEWIAYRRSRKLTNNEQSVRGQLAKLAELAVAGHNPAEVIRDSITNGWQGLFEPKARQPQKITPIRPSAHALPPAGKGHYGTSTPVPEGIDPNDWTGVAL